MKKVEPQKSFEKDDMKPEYDFSTMKGGVRGKYYKAYRQGHQIEVQEEDGTVSVQYFRLEDGVIMFEPDVREYFPDSESVNKALRTLIEIIPSKERPSQPSANLKANKKSRH